MGISDLLPVKELYELVKKGTRLEAEEEIMKYRELLLEQTGEIINLKDKINELEKKLNIKEKIEKSDKGLFVIKDDGTKDGPYCVRCSEVDEKLITLDKKEYDNRYYFECPECKHIYDKDDYRFTV